MPSVGPIGRWGDADEVLFGCGNVGALAGVRPGASRRRRREIRRIPTRHAVQMLSVCKKVLAALVDQGATPEELQTFEAIYNSTRAATQRKEVVESGV